MEQKETNGKLLIRPEDAVRVLATDEDIDIRIAIAKRKNLPEDVIRTLANDKDRFVRQAIAKRKDLPEDLIRTLANDRDLNVRETIAKRDGLPEDVIRTLATDKDADVRYALAIDEYVLTTNDHVLADRIDLPEDVVRTLATDKDFRVRIAIAKRKDLPEDLIRTLANDRDLNVRETIAKREDLPEDVLRVLAADKSKGIRYAITWRDNLPGDVIRTLAKDHDEGVRHRAVDFIKQKYSETMNNSEAVFPDTGKKLWANPPYEITELKYDDSLRHIDFIAIKNGNKIKTSFSGKAIDENNCLNFIARDFLVKYDLASGKAEFYPAQKQVITLPERPIERDEPVYHVKPRLVELAGGGGTTLYDIVMDGQVKNTFNRIEEPSEGFSVVVKDGRCNYLSTKTGELLCKSWLDKALPFKDGKAVCQIDKAGYIIDTKGMIQKRFSLETKKPGMRI